MDEEQLSRTFAALADPTRRDLVARLAVADATLTELATSYDVSVQAVSKHLKVLEEAGLVRRTKDAQRRPCHLEAEVLDLMTGWIERRRREVEERYQRLDEVLARMAAEEHPEQDKEKRHDEAPRDRDHRPRGTAGDRDRAGVRRPAGAGVPRPRRGRPAQAVAGPASAHDGGRPVRHAPRRFLRLPAHRRGR